MKLSQEQSKAVIREQPTVASGIYWTLKTANSQFVPGSSSLLCKRVNFSTAFSSYGWLSVKTHISFCRLVSGLSRRDLTRHSEKSLHIGVKCDVLTSSLLTIWVVCLHVLYMYLYFKCCRLVLSLVCPIGPAVEKQLVTHRLRLQGGAPKLRGNANSRKPLLLALHSERTTSTPGRGSHRTGQQTWMIFRKPETHTRTERGI